MADHPSPGEDYHYLNPHLDGPVRPSGSRLAPALLFAAAVAFTILLGVAWFLLSIQSRAGQ
jgi:hypothetical protein